jgi:secondary thiamine-phosphate synthase enzyme
VLKDSFVVETAGRSLVDITARVNEIVARAPAMLCTIFCHHTSASLIINENADPTVLADLERWISRAVTDGDAMFKHRDEGDDDMSAHVRTALTSTSLSLPVANGKLDLGTWQAVFLWEHRTAPHRRKISVVLV